MHKINDETLDELPGMATPEELKRFEEKIDRDHEAAMTFYLDRFGEVEELAPTAGTLTATAFNASASAALHALPSTHRPGPTKRVTIRIPHAVVDAFDSEARRRGIGYQTLINQSLATISAGW